MILLKINFGFTMTGQVTNLSTYSFRHTTIERKKETEGRSSPFRKSRSVLKLDQTASLLRDTGHDCSELETQSSVTKVSTRFIFSMFRFLMAHAWECKTIR